MRPSGAAHELGTSLSHGAAADLSWSGRLLAFPGEIPTERHMGVAQLEERRSPKPKVAGSTPVARADPGLWASGCSLRTQQRTMRERVKHRPTEVPSARPRRTRRPARCQRGTQDAARYERPAPAAGGGSARCGVSASIPALGAGGRGSTPCISTLAPSSSMVERTPDTRTVGGSRPPSATHPHARDDPRR